ncbi:MAG: hypothetical protein ACE5FS_15400 [Paracoccaceae bacterium]
MNRHRRPAAQYAREEMKRLHHLVTADTASLEAGRLAFLRDRLGHEGCRDFIDETVFLIVERLSRLNRLVGEGEFGEAYHAAYSVHLLSDQIGISGLSRVARDAMDCAATGDARALPAVVARLERVAEESLFLVVDLADRFEQ